MRDCRHCTALFQIAVDAQGPQLEEDGSTAYPDEDEWSSSTDEWSSSTDEGTEVTPRAQAKGTELDSGRTLLGEPSAFAIPHGDLTALADLQDVLFRRSP